MFPINSASSSEMLKILPEEDWLKFGHCMKGTENNRNWGVAPEPPNQFLPTEVAEIDAGKLANYDGCTDTFDTFDATTGTGERAKNSSYCCTYNEVKREADEVLRVLKKYNVKVRRPTGFNVANREGNYGEMFTKMGGMNQFSRDVMQVVGNVIFELQPGASNRKGELLNYYAQFEDLQKSAGDNGLALLQMPYRDYTKQNTGGYGPPKTKFDVTLCNFLETIGITNAATYDCIATYDKNDYAVLEGGDVMLMGDTILVGTSENRAMGSSLKGVEWLQNALKFLGIDKTVVAVPMHPRILHLDLVMSLPRPGLAIVADGPLPGGGLPFTNGVPKELDQWKQLHVSGLAGMYMAANCLPISEDVLMMVSNQFAPPDVQNETNVLHQQVRDEGITVEVMDMGFHGMFGGALRCSTHPIRRRSKNLNPSTKSSGHKIAVATGVTVIASAYLML